MAVTVISCVIVVFCVILILNSVTSELVDHNTHVERSRYKRQSIVYNQELSQSQIFPEDSDLNSTVLFDFNSVNINGQAASSYRFEVVKNQDSKPPNPIFRIDGQQVKFATGLSEVERSKNFDYEKYPEVVIVVEAVHNTDVDELEKKLLKLTIPLSDVNDEPPELINKPFPYLAAMSVNAGEGVTVYELMAQDPDSNADIEYSIDFDNAGADIRNIFRMDPVSEGSGVVGHIKVNARRTFVKGTKYIIPVKVRDRNGAFPQIITANVDVLVGPRAPQFYMTKYVGSIFETESSNSPVYTADDSSAELIVKVRSFQGNFPKTFQVMEDNTAESKRFRIDEKGHIFNKESLDYDIEISQRPPVFQLFIKVTETLDDGTKLENTVPLEIVVRDENDNSPHFQLTQYLKTIPENEAIGNTILRVFAEDKDSGKNSELEYEIDPADGNSQYFDIQKVVEGGRTIGAITVKAKLDYDALPGPIYRFTVIAKDGGAPSLSNSVDVIVTMTNVNDEKPVIQDQESLVLRDGLDLPYFLTRLRAQDADGDGVKFYLSQNDEKVTTLDIFRIIPSSGVIEVFKDVPSGIDSYTLEVIAEDDGGCCEGSNKNKDTIKFLVEIVDSVNQKPTFDDCLSYTTKASFKEESDPGTPVIKVHARDMGRGLNGIIRYAIVSPNPTLQDAPFQIDPVSGEITVKSVVDREAEGANFIQVTVKAIDQGESPQEGWCTFRVKIEDINDNDPVFNTKRYSQAVSTKTSAFEKVVLRVTAVDKDIGKNAEIVYTLQDKGGGSFGIYNESGIIFMKNDFTETKEYTLVVKAQDKGDPPRTAMVEVDIKVSAEKKVEPPKFVNGPRKFPVDETDPINSFITDFRCITNQTDSSPSRVQFFLVDKDGSLRTRKVGKFSIESAITAKENKVSLYVAERLDYETQTQHTVTLRCQNIGQLTMYEQIEVTIDVRDTNDEVPIFPGWLEDGVYKASVKENQDNALVKDDIRADDSDVSPEFKKITYVISPESYLGVENDFAITTLEGDDGNAAAIRTKKAFDREQQKDYILIVIASDGVPSSIVGRADRGEPNTASVVVLVTIEDENDNAMYFKQSLYNHTVKETANIGDVIFAVTADDEDEVDKGRLLYNFEEDNIPFDIRDQTGDIFVIGKLDYESDRKEYRLKLTSKDSIRRFTAQTEVLITVTDENDNVPVFAPNVYEVRSVTEEDKSVNRSNPLSLAKVMATDKDISRTKQIRYKLLGEGTEQGPNRLFTIDELTGEIYLITTLDRDKPRGKAEYIFTVEALDEEEDPQKGYANVKVFPKDINDNKPVFDRDSLMDSIPEHTAEGEFVAQVKATDADAGINAEITYDIIKSPATTDDIKTNYFRIKTNGEIFSQVDPKFLDRESMPKLEVMVKATDKGNPTQSATAMLTIRLTDINDNPPKFTQDEYTHVISENTKSGFFLEVQATDDDIDENALLTFSIDENSHFKIDTLQNKGYIFIKTPVDYEKPEQRSFLLNIFVTDKDFKDSAVVKITVEDFNDNPPVFNNAFKTIPIKEGLPPGKIVTTFTAEDKDSSINAELSYAIDRKSDPRREFIIDPDSGEVRTRKSLDRETAAKMEIIIWAIDKGDPQLTGTATLVVIVEDVNDNYPIFKEDYLPVVMENGGRSDLPLDVYAKDLDEPQNGPPFGFRLPDSCQTQDVCQKFSLEFDKDGDNGNGIAVISTEATFDREKQKYYLLPIVMWDKRGKKNSSDTQTGTNTLTIVIGDENDNKHSPGHQEVFVYNYKGTFGPLVIGRVYVEDKDDWDLPDKTFSFISPSSLKSYFSVDTDNGDITMKKGVQANFGKEPYKFSVTVYDKHFDLKVVSTVAVTVMDLSEEAVSNSGGVRFSGITSSEFIIEPVDKSGEKTESLYKKFQKLLASKLGYPVENVEIITLRDGDGYLEVRYSAHASPYLSAAEMDNVVIMNQAEFEALGLKVAEVPIDECQDEIFEGGCYNKLTITGKPVTINSNGTSYVGVEAYMVATQGCEADTFPSTNECTGDYCHNGGTCSKNDGGSLECTNCPDGYTGSRCQERRHSFDGKSVAVYKTLSQCEESQTSIEFITKKRDGVILYNGPLRASSKTSDFILLMLKDGFPVLHIDHGTGVAELTLDGKDKDGNQLVQELSDGEWHHIDINRKGKEVEMVVDKCKDALTTTQWVEDDRACRVKKNTPGGNMYLNVNSLLQLGGVRLLEAGVPHLSSLSLNGFDGCLRNLIHNKQLYDLHYKEVSGVDTGKNGCPREDLICNPAGEGPKCGKNGDCEATLDGAVVCTCHSGFWGKKCEKEATIRDYEEGGYYLWKMKDDFFNEFSRHREVKVHIRFRTRQNSGQLVVLEDTSSTGTAHHIRLMLREGHAVVTYNLGDGEKELKLTSQANNGQWHNLVMERYGTEFHLKMDNGEGRNYAFTLGSTGQKERAIFKFNSRVYSGGYKQSGELKSTCVQDVRIDNGYFAMNAEEGIDEYAVARVDENPNTKEGCTRNDCDATKCRNKPNSVCYPLWETFDCRCKKGYYGNQCVSMCIPNPCFNNVTCTNTDEGFSCKCPARWSGKLCDELGPEEVVSSDMSDTALIAILISIFVVIVIALLVFLLYFKLCRNGEDGEKYILEVDPEDDIRENVMNYDEEGAGEKDQDAYDISRLQPMNELFNRPYDPDKRRDVPLRNAPGDKPEVGNFIEDRMQDADNDDGAPPHDSVREFNFEGGDSDAGSLSSLNTSSSDRSQDYDYLNEWGPKFSKLADMYGAGQDLPNS